MLFQVRKIHRNLATPNRTRYRLEFDSSLLAEVEDGVVSGVARLQDLSDVVDGVLVGRKVHPVGGAGHAGDARGQQVQVEVLRG